MFMDDASQVGKIDEDFNLENGQKVIRISKRRLFPRGDN